jgi:large conductance mechanosensitive channel
MNLQQIFQEFKQFATKGNVVDMAIGVIIGGAFGTIVKSLVDDVMMPPLGLILGSVDFTDLYITMKPGSGPATTLEQARKLGAVTLNYGLFINAVIQFLIVAFAMFMVVRAFNKVRQNLEAIAKAEADNAPAAEPTTKDCPYCRMAVPLLAVRCGHCTSKLDDGELLTPAATV